MIFSSKMLLTRQIRSFSGNFSVLILFILAGALIGSNFVLIDLNKNDTISDPVSTIPLIGEAWFLFTSINPLYLLSVLMLVIYLFVIATRMFLYQKEQFLRFTQEKGFNSFRIYLLILFEISLIFLLGLILGIFLGDTIAGWYYIISHEGKESAVDKVITSYVFPFNINQEFWFIDTMRNLTFLISFVWGILIFLVVFTKETFNALNINSAEFSKTENELNPLEGLNIKGDLLTTIFGLFIIFGVLITQVDIHNSPFLIFLCFVAFLMFIWGSVSLFILVISFGPQMIQFVFRDLFGRTQGVLASKFIQDPPKTKVMALGFLVLALTFSTLFAASTPTSIDINVNDAYFTSGSDICLKAKRISEKNVFLNDTNYFTQFNGVVSATRIYENSYYYVGTSTEGNTTPLLFINGSEYLDVVPIVRDDFFIGGTAKQLLLNLSMTPNTIILSEGRSKIIGKGIGDKIVLRYGSSTTTEVDKVYEVLVIGLVKYFAPGYIDSEKHFGIMDMSFADGSFLRPWFPYNYERYPVSKYLIRTDDLTDRETILQELLNEDRIAENLDAFGHTTFSMELVKLDSYSKTNYLPQFLGMNAFSCLIFGFVGFLIVSPSLVKARKRIENYRLLRALGLKRENQFYIGIVEELTLIYGSILSSILLSWILANFINVLFLPETTVPKIDTTIIVWELIASTGGLIIAVIGIQIIINPLLIVIDVCIDILTAIASFNTNNINQALNSGKLLDISIEANGSAIQIIVDLIITILTVIFDILAAIISFDPNNINNAINSGKLLGIDLRTFSNTVGELVGTIFEIGNLLVINKACSIAIFELAVIFIFASAVYGYWNIQQRIQKNKNGNPRTIISSAGKTAMIGITILVLSQVFSFIVRSQPDVFKFLLMDFFIPFLDILGFIILIEAVFWAFALFLNQTTSVSDEGFISKIAGINLAFLNIETATGEEYIPGYVLLFLNVLTVFVLVLIYPQLILPILVLLVIIIIIEVILLIVASYGMVLIADQNFKLIITMASVISFLMVTILYFNRITNLNVMISSLVGAITIGSTIYLISPSVKRIYTDKSSQIISIISIITSLVFLGLYFFMPFTLPNITFDLFLVIISIRYLFPVLAISTVLMGIILLFRTISKEVSLPQ